MQHNSKSSDNIENMEVTSNQMASYNEQVDENAFTFLTPLGTCMTLEFQRSNFHPYTNVIGCTTEFTRTTITRLIAKAIVYQSSVLDSIATETLVTKLCPKICKSGARTCTKFIRLAEVIIFSPIQCPWKLRVVLSEVGVAAMVTVAASSLGNTGSARSDTNTGAGAGVAGCRSAGTCVCWHAGWRSYGRHGKWTSFESRHKVWTAVGCAMSCRESRGNYSSKTVVGVARCCSKLGSIKKPNNW